MIYKTNSGYGVNFNQLVENGDFIGTTSWYANGATITAADNIATVTKTAELGYVVNAVANLTVGHKYFKTLQFKGIVGVRYNFNGEFPATDGTGDWVTLTAIVINDTNTKYIALRTNETANFQPFQVRRVWYSDLTQDFGSGNEPTTVAEFREMYSNDYYDYTLSQWQWSKKGKITSYPTPVIENGITLLPIEHHIVGVVKPELSDISLMKLKTGSYKNTNNQGPYVEVKEGNEIIINTPSTDALYGQAYLTMANTVVLKAGHTYYTFLDGERRAGDWNAVVIDFGNERIVANFTHINDGSTSEIRIYTPDTDKNINLVRVFMATTSTHYDNYSVRLIITENRQYLIDKGIISQ